MQPPNPAASDQRRAAMETYWREVQSIEEEQDDEEERKSLDDLELEAAWLVQSGLSALTQDLDPKSGNDLDLVQDSSRPVGALLLTLTRRQTDTVRHRLHNYTESLRQRDRTIRDVRCVFTQTDSDSDSAPVEADFPKHFHKTTRAIHRQHHRVRPRLSLSTFISEGPTSPLSPASPVQTPPPQTNRAADWLLRDAPYSEGVAEHRKSGACPDCIGFRDNTNNTNEAMSCFSPDSGLSSVEDLSELDLRNISFIAHIELHTILQILDQNRTKTKVQNRLKVQRRRSREGAVFGVPLKTLLENDRKKCPELKTPLIFTKLITVLDQTGLKTEGILRISGSICKLKSFRRDLDCSLDLDWPELRPVDAAGLLKLFIRELPSPLLHLPLGTLKGIKDVQSEVHQIQCLQLLCLLLPEAHRNMLQELLSFLSRVVEHQESNRMSLWNVAMVMAPNLLHDKHKQGVTHDVEQEMEEAVPSFLLAQVRQMNQASNQKRGGASRSRKRLQRPKKPQEPLLCDDVIRVRAPLQLKVSTAMRLDATTTARNVTERFPHDANSVDELRLYEVGGNIGERRLHPDCCLMDVYRVNPGCDWLIKP